MNSTDKRGWVELESSSICLIIYEDLQEASRKAKLTAPANLFFDACSLPRAPFLAACTLGTVFKDSATLTSADIIKIGLGVLQG